jgi:uncharacterized membrane-anchored protein
MDEVGKVLELFIGLGNTVMSSKLTITSLLAMQLNLRYHPVVTRTCVVAVMVVGIGIENSRNQVWIFLRTLKDKN